MADESQPAKKDEPVVEEIVDEPKAGESKEEASDSDSGLEDLPDLE